MNDALCRGMERNRRRETLPVRKTHYGFPAGPVVGCTMCTMNGAPYQGLGRNRRRETLPVRKTHPTVSRQARL